MTRKATHRKPRNQAADANRKNPPKAPFRLEMIRAGDLADNPANWRRHPTGQLSALKNLLRDPAVGWAAPLLYNERTERLIDGHARKRVVGPEEFVPVLIGSWSPEAEKKILVTLDTSSRMAETDADALRSLLKDVDLDGEDLAGLAGTLDELLESGGNGEAKEGKTDPDAVPEPPSEPVSMRGKVYLLGEHRLMCGDALSRADRAILAYGERCGCCITSPPYNVGIEYSGYRDKKAKEAYLAFIRDAADGVFELLANGRFCAWNMGVSPRTFHAHQVVILEAVGFEFYRQIIWHKAGVAYQIFPSSVKAKRIRHYCPNYVHEIIAVMEKPEDEQPLTETCPICEGEGKVQALTSCTGIHEVVILVTKGEAELGEEHRPSKTYPNDVWKIAQSAASAGLKTLGTKSTTLKKSGKSSHMIKEHPAAYPAEVPRALIGYMMDQDEVVYDPFLGSGTTIIAAEQMGRRCYGMEIEPRYVDVARRRWAEFVHGEGCDWAILTPAEGLKG